MNSRKLNFGCGFDKRTGYINADVDPACEPDLLLINNDLSNLPKRHFTEILAKDVLEHIPRNQSLKILLEFSSLLNQNGILDLQTSYVTNIIKQMEENANFADQYGWTICLFGNQTHPGDFHFTGFTEITLKVHIVAAGFEILESTLIDKWMPRLICKKIHAWDDLLTTTIDDIEFLQLAYQAAFNRDLDNTGKTHFGQLLQKKVKSRREILMDIYSSPERLYVTSRNLGV